MFGAVRVTCDGLTSLREFGRRVFREMGLGLLRSVIAFLVVVAVTAGITACGGSPDSMAKSTARRSTKTSTQTGDGRPTNGGQTSDHSRDIPASGARALPCNEFIGTQAPERDMRLILGVVALPTSPHSRRALQTTRSDLHDPAAGLFAKSGLEIRAGARLRLIVPDRLRDELSIGWGNAGEGHRGTTITVDNCTGPPGVRWLAYAGGYYVRAPLCASLLVTARRQQRRVRIGVGKACLGQRPPPEPTQR